MREFEVIRKTAENIFFIVLTQKRSNFCLPKVTSFFIQAAGLVYHRRTTCGVYHQGRRAALAYHHAPACIYLRLDDIHPYGLMIYRNGLRIPYNGCAVDLYNAKSRPFGLLFALYKTTAHIIYKNKRGSVALKKTLSATAVAAGVLTVISFALRGLGMLFRVYLSGRMGSAGLGLYQLVMSVYSLFATFATSGFTVAVSRLVAEKLEQADTQKAKGGAFRVLCMSSAMSLLLASLASALLYLGADYMANSFILDGRTAAPLRILALSMPFMALSACLKGYFTAVGQIYKPSLASLFEQCAKIAIIVYSIEVYYQGVRSPSSLCVAVVAGLTAGEALSYVFLFVLYLFFSGRGKNSISPAEPPLKTAKSIAAVCLPIAASSYVTNILHSIESVLIPIQFVRYGGDRDAALSAFGTIRGMTIPMLFFPFAFLGALYSIQVPAISRLNTVEDKGERNRLIGRIMRICFAFSIVSGGVFFMFPGVTSLALYGSTECVASTRILALVTPFMYIETVSDGILKSIGEQNKTLLYSIINSVFRIASVLVLIPLSGVKGYLWLLIASNLLSFVLCYRRLKRVTGYRASLIDDVALPLLFTLAGGVSAMPLAGLELHRTFKAVLVCSVCVSVYLLLHKLTGRKRRWKAF